MSVNSTLSGKIEGRATIVHTAHPYVAGDIGKWLAQNGAITQLSNWISDTQPDVLGMLTAIIDANTVEYAFSGTVTGMAGLTDDATYWGGIVAGAMSLTAPAVSGAVAQPLGQARGTTAFLVKIGTRNAPNA